MEQDIHPKHAQAIAEAELRRLTRDRLLDSGREAAENLGLKFIHETPDGTRKGFGGMTIAYAPQNGWNSPNRKQNVFAVATALCNPVDSYSKKLGRAYAALNFEAGNNVLIFVPEGWTAYEWIKMSFGVNVGD
jgi:hypothetical protein